MEQYNQKVTERGKRREDDYNPEEEQKLCLMRTFVESHDPSAKVIDDLTLRRFLRARDLDVEKGGGQFLKYLEWRMDFVPKGHITESEILTELAQNKLFQQGYDRKGCPVSVILGRHHFQNKQSGGLDELKRFIVYGLDKLCGKLPAGEEKFLAILDLQGWGYANSDIRGSKALIAILQDFYPERVRKILLLHVPKIFMAVWKMVYPFIDKKTREKIVFVENKQLKATLLEEIEERQLPEIYGGRQPLVPIHRS